MYWGLFIDPNFLDPGKNLHLFEHDKPQPERVFGIRTIDCPPKAKQALISALVNSPGPQSGQPNYKLWRMQSQEGKVALIAILK